MIGLGKMGGNMATRLVQKGISVVGFDRSADIVKTLEENAKIIGASSVKDAVTKLEGQKIIWLMVPAGVATEEQINELIPMLNKGDIIIDDDTIDHIVENYTNAEKGIRTLKRCIETIYTKLNLYRLMKPDTKLFENEATLDVKFPYTVTKDIVDKLIKSEYKQNLSLKMMYC